MGQHLVRASNRCVAMPDHPQAVLRPVPPQARFQSLLFQVGDGAVNASPTRRNQAVALYGLSDAQMQLSRFVRGELDMQNVATIANYNRQLGIVHYSRSDATHSIAPHKLIQEFSRHISAAAAGKLAKRAPKPTPPIIQAWADYLGAHHQRLDPFVRLGKLLADVPREERAAVATRFVLKNTSGGCRTETTVNTLLYLIHSCGCKDAESVVAALGKHTLGFQDLLDLSELFIKHFFRNTSKLGLAFFAAQGAEIAIAWNAPGAGKMDIESIRQKPWQAQQRRFQNSYEPITYSEVRSVLRQPALFDGKVSKVYIAGDSVELADSPASEEWVALPRPIAAPARPSKQSARRQ
ncbi:hypothetical protein CXB49_14550 [Chromobacterium sp. ATCC 53434]|uniref:hypothetical protein n=1 Tax=Chromobacterium sp. (strain ATCC 53434 / SC 14030) TaxID=2059672 RepID=UPI000C776623|nr:hypothetical protein [Chromobacterium sp. ATCC 53434]AUH51953.1 hypothetical protein CXB49_14550 [Chromobacterium sp. ATCC 53434]